MLNAVSATLAISRRPVLVAFYDTHGDTEDIFSTYTPGFPRGLNNLETPKIKSAIAKINAFETDSDTASVLVTG